MNALRHLITSATLAAGTATLACSCFGPQTFCETLNPPFPDPEWWIPDAIVLGVKLTDVQHGMDVKILQSFSGTLQADDTIRIWGDCGLLCRHYPGTWAIGDTVIWGFKITDLMGNGLCGTSYEQPTDYMISICGIYYLDYANGFVTGPITTETPETMPMTQFGELVIDCLSTGVHEGSMADQLVVWYDEGVPVIEMPGIGGSAELRMFDMHGRNVVSLSWDGRRTRMESLRRGVYLVEVRSASACEGRKLVVH